MQQGSAQPVVIVVAGSGMNAGAVDTLARGIAAAGFRVLRAGEAAGGRDAAAALAAQIRDAKGGAAVLVGVGGGAAAARRVAVDHPELVRGLALVGEPAPGADAAGQETPSAPALGVVGADDPNRARQASNQKSWGSRYTLAEVAGAGATVLDDQPQAVQRALVDWLRGPALSSTRPGARIAAPADDVLTAEQKPLRQQMKDSLQSAAGARAGVIGPREVLIHDMGLLRGYTAIGDTIANAPLPVRLKELAIIVVARAFDSDYEWYAHGRAALGAGVPAAAVEAIRHGRAPPLTRADEQIVYDYSHEITATHKVSDATYRKTWDLLGTNGLLYLTQTIGHYMGVATTLNVHTFTLPADAQPLPAIRR